MEEILILSAMLFKGKLNQLFKNIWAFSEYIYLKKKSLNGLCE